MDSLFHFIFPIIAALASSIHTKHKIKDILVLGILTVALDFDHFISPGLERAMFHNIFLTFMIPAIMVFLTFELKKNIYSKGFTILLLLFLTSHVFLDLFTEPGVALLYPFSREYFSINFDISVPIISGFSSEGSVISSYGLGLLGFFIIIFLPCLFLDKVMEKMENDHEDFSKAVKEILKS